MSENVEIYVLDKQVRLLQPADGFRTSLDSVMLAAACPAQGRQRVLDMGCGVGGAAFCVLHRVPDCHVTGVDVQDCHVDLAQQNIELNNAEGRAAFMAADIRDYDVDAPDERFDHVICNPPYLEAGEYTPSPKEKKAKALGHHSSRHSEGRREPKNLDMKKRSFAIAQDDRNNDIGRLGWCRVSAFKATRQLDNDPPCRCDRPDCAGFGAAFWRD